MREPTKEWLMVCDLMLLESKLGNKQREYVVTLYENLDPHESFLGQQSAKQLKWLKWMHDKVCKNITPDW